MKRLSIIKTAMGIGVCLSSLWGASLPMFAVSLKGGSQYQVVNWAGETFVVGELFSEPILQDSLAGIPTPIDPAISPQLQIQFYSTADFRDLFDSLSPEANSGIYPDLPLDSIAQLQVDAIATNDIDTDRVQQATTSQATSLFEYLVGSIENKESASGLQIQIGSPEEDENLLQYVGTALSGLNISGNATSTNRAEVEILPQVNYRNIFRDVYDFEVDIVAAPRTVNSPLPDNLLVTQESAINYSLVGTQQQISTVPQDYDTTPGSLFGASSVDSILFDDSFLQLNEFDSRVSNVLGGDLDRRVGLASPTEGSYVPVSQQVEIEPIYGKVSNSSDRINQQKSSMQLELEAQAAERIKRINEKRSNLQKRLQDERQRREMRRKHLQRQTDLKRRQSLRQQTRRQQDQMRRQRESF